MGEKRSIISLLFWVRIFNVTQILSGWYPDRISRRFHKSNMDVCADWVGCAEAPISLNTDRMDRAPWLSSSSDHWKSKQVRISDRHWIALVVYYVWMGKMTYRTWSFCGKDLSWIRASDSRIFAITSCSSGAPKITELARSKQLKWSNKNLSLFCKAERLCVIYAFRNRRSHPDCSILVYHFLQHA